MVLSWFRRRGDESPLPDDTEPGTYQLLVGLYDESGRRTLTLANGRETDHLVLPVVVDTP